LPGRRRLTGARYLVPRRQIIRGAVGGTQDDVVIFTGPGATAADKPAGILELRIPAGLDERYQIAAQFPAAGRPSLRAGRRPGRTCLRRSRLRAVRSLHGTDTSPAHRIRPLDANA
jgi:hypothetical protein